MLEQRFDQAHLAPIRMRSELSYRRRGRGKSLQTFLSEILRLAEQAFSKATISSTEQVTLDTFTDGIHNWEIQSPVRVSRLYPLPTRRAS